MTRWLWIALAACGHPGPAADPGAGTPSFAVTSSSFAADGAIPAVHTCQGDDLPPSLAWTGAPPQTRSFAIVVEDPDAPGGTFVHWVLADLPATATGFPNGATGSMTGTNDFGNRRWNGPCPPIGRHHYIFKVYALDAEHLGAPAMAKPALVAAITGHVLAMGTLVGTYEKTARVTPP